MRMIWVAGVVKLVDAGDSKSPGAWLRVGSSPTSGTIHTGDASPLILTLAFRTPEQILAPRNGWPLNREA